MARFEPREGEADVVPSFDVVRAGREGFGCTIVETLAAPMGRAEAAATGGLSGE